MTELLVRTPASRWLLGGMVVSSLGSGLTLPFLVVYLHAVRGLALPTAGLALAAAGLMGLVAGLVAGGRVDRLGAGPTLLAGLLLEGIGAAALAGVTNFPEAVLVASVIGAAEGITWPALSSMLALAIPEELRQRAYSSQFMLMNLGIGVGGLVSGSVVSVRDPFTFQIIYLADAASFLAFGLVLLGGIRAGAVPARTAAQARGGEDVAAGSYLAVLGDRTFTGLLLCSLGVVLFGYSQVEAGFSVFATEVVGVSPRVVGLAFAANCFVIVAAQGRVTSVTRHRSRITTIALGAVVVAFSWCLVGISALPGLGVVAVGLLLLAASVFGLGETLFAPVWSTLVNELAPDHLRGRYNALAASVWGVTGVVGPPMGTSLLATGIPALWIGPLVAGCLVTAAGTLQVGRRVPVQGHGSGGEESSG